MSASWRQPTSVNLFLVTLWFVKCREFGKDDELVGQPAITVHVADHAQGLRQKVIGEDYVIDAPLPSVPESGGRDRHPIRYVSTPDS